MKPIALQEVLSAFETGKRPKGGAVDQGVPSLGGEHVTAESTLKLTGMKFVPTDFFDSMTKGHVQRGDVLVVKDGATTGRVGMVEPGFPFERAAVNEHLFLLRTDRRRLEPQFLYFYLRSGRGQAELMSDFRGAAQGGISREIGSKVRIPLPTLGEQQRIVDLLARAEGIVRLRRQAQQKTVALIPAIFVDMFGDPATNPKGLDVVALGDVLASADYGSSAKAGDEEIGLPMIRMGNVDYSGNVDLAALKYVDLPPAEVARFGLKDGDILFNRTNSKELVGKTGLWIGDREAILASYFIRLRVDEQLARPFFVWACMNTPHMKRVLFETARGAIGQANINSRELRAFRIPLPALDEQVRFEARCRDVLALRGQQDQAAAKAEAAFQALLARAFSAPSQAVVGHAQEESTA